MLYKAFVSYSRAADGRLAPALQSALHRFAKPWYRLRAIRVFRDVTNLSVSPGLWSSIENALSQSEYLLLLASPRAAASKWVRREVDYWLQHRSSATLLIVLTDGELAWDGSTGDFDWGRTDALPDTLRRVFGEEPAYLDFRTERTADDLSSGNPHFQEKVATIAATLHGRSRDDLIGEDVRQQRRAKRLAWSASIALFLLTVTASIGAYVAVRQRRIAEERGQLALARQLAAQGELMRNQQARLLPRSLLLGVESMAILSSLEADEVLRQGMGLLARPVEAIRLPSAERIVALSPGSKFALTAREQAIGLWDARTGASVAGVNLDDPLEQAVFSPDDGIVALVTRTGIQLLETSGQSLARIGHEGHVSDLAFDRTRTLLACACGAAGLRIWEVATGRELSSLPHEKEVSSVAFDPSGRYLMSGGNDFMATLWERRPWRASRGLPHQGAVVKAVFSRDGSRLVTAAVGGQLCLWDTSTGRLVSEQSQEDTELLRLSPDGSVIATAGGGTARLWELASGRRVSELAHEGRITHLSFNANGALVLTADSSGVVRLRSSRTSEEVSRALVEGSIGGVAVTGRDQFLTAAGNVLQSWKAGGGAEVRALQQHYEAAALAFSPDGSRMATAGTGDGTARVWNVKDGTQVAALPRHLGSQTDVAFGPDGQALATGSVDGVVRITRVSDHQTLREWDLENVVNAVAFDRNGTRLAVATQENELVGGGFDGVIVLDVTGDERMRLEQVGGVADVSFSPDGRLLATAGGGMMASPTSDHTARIWTMPEGREARRLSHQGTVLAVAFSGDGRYLATGTATTKADAAPDDAVYVWEVATGRRLARIPHDAGVNGVAFAGLGEELVVAAATARGEARLWSVPDSRPLARVSHGGSISDVAFSPDGRLLVTAGTGGTRLWLWRRRDLMAEACAHLNRNLTSEEWNSSLGETRPYHKTCPGLPIHPSYVEAGRVMARSGNLDDAIGRFRHARDLEPSLTLDPETEARRERARGLMESVAGLAVAGDVEGGRRAIQEARELDSDVKETDAADELERVAETLINNDRVAEALVTLTLAREMHGQPGVGVGVWNDLCFHGSLLGRAAQVLEACEEAVRLDPANGRIHDSRGLALALLGRHREAASDFALYVSWKGEPQREADLILRKQWIEKLGAGENPFSRAVLDELHRRTHSLADDIPQEEPDLKPRPSERTSGKPAKFPTP
jgi:WD40 repeat protein